MKKWSLMLLTVIVIWLQLMMSPTQATAIEPPCIPNPIPGGACIPIQDPCIINPIGCIPLIIPSNPLSVVTYEPADDSTDIATVTLTFNENVRGVSGKKIKLYNADDDAWISSNEATGGGVSINGNKVKIHFSIKYNRSYYIMIDAGAFQNLAGTSVYGGISDKTTWNFTTKPIVKSYFPANNATDVAIDTNLALTFNGIIGNTDSDSDVYEIRKVSDDSVVEEFSSSSSNVTVTNDTVTIDLKENLAYDTAYYIQSKDIGSGGFRIDQPNTSIWDWYEGIKNNTTWRFTTQSNPSKTVMFDSQGGTAVEGQTVANGAGVTVPSPPTRAGYTFVGWYKEATLQTLWNFATDKVTDNLTLYAKWNAISLPDVTPPTIIDSTPSSDLPSPVPSNRITVNVVDASNPNAVLVQTVITRENNGGVVKDTVNFTPENARESIEKLVNQATKQSRMVIPDEQQQVSETTVGIAREAARLLAEGQTGLGIDMEAVKFDIPATSLANFDHDFYFRVVPVKAQTTKQQLEERAKAETSVQQFTNNATITLLGQPMTIETNMQNRPVTLTLPLPQNVTQEQLANLAVYIEHSDGTKEVVRGKVVDFKAGVRGVTFEVTKFSTFSILYAPVKKEQVKEEVKVEEEVTPASKPYIKGYADGTFRPEASVTRAQMASMMARYVTDNEIPEATATFTDTATHDAKDAIEFVKETGLFKGTTETTFNPNGSITRAQMATVVARWLEENGETTASQGKVFKDVSNNYWAAEAIAVVSAQGIMTGTSTTTFNPEGYLTRAQAVKVLNRLFERQVTATEQAPLFTDVPSNHWAFDEIQAAAQ
ncbi:S-layer homology domain-containing protein [Lysinibacillus piscis]|uniref:SLH domain-containing protein n=1 Tax=Lysinibacillus piscis TaxID=2518931 RepID=A0ABQ5NHX1_9BACI|nr:S-layer homology domain-containing protein [Lysinibacillus sp. KH24]GLC87697.1 hypothetical protein LYSBPC_08240 [Lysinibacillus sp. KH24]